MLQIGPIAVPGYALDISSSGTTTQDFEGIRILNRNANAAQIVSAGILFAVTNSLGLTFSKIASAEDAVSDDANSSLVFYTGAGTGSAPTEKMRIRSGGNVQLGNAGGNLLIGGSVGATAARTLALSNAATAPSNSVDLCHLFSADTNGAGTAGLAAWQEAAPYAGIGVASTHKIPTKWNGTTLYLLATTVA
jgi:hypothetical protein